LAVYLDIIVLKKNQIVAQLIIILNVVTINNVEIPIAAVTKYLGMHLNHKLSWRDHIVMKRKQIELKVK
jgi:hypothetical protein